MYLSFITTGKIAKIDFCVTLPYSRYRYSSIVDICGSDLELIPYLGGLSDTFKVTLNRETHAKAFIFKGVGNPLLPPCRFFFVYWIHRTISDNSGKQQTKADKWLILKALTCTLRVRAFLFWSSDIGQQKTKTEKDWLFGVTYDG